jgi:hypothetical protein
MELQYNKLVIFFKYISSMLLVLFLSFFISGVLSKSFTNFYDSGGLHVSLSTFSFVLIYLISPIGSIIGMGVSLIIIRLLLVDSRIRYLIASFASLPYLMISVYWTSGVLICSVLESLYLLSISVLLYRTNGVRVNLL